MQNKLIKLFFLYICLVIVFEICFFKSYDFVKTQFSFYSYRWHKNRTYTNSQALSRVIFLQCPFTCVIKKML